LNVRTYDDADAPRVLELLQASFGDWPGPRVAASDRPADFFRWKHADNPHGPSFIVLAEDEGQLVGMRAYMPWRLSADGAETTAVQAVDLATHPDHRGKGVNTQLTKHAIPILRETKPFAFGLPNDLSRSQSRKVGWRLVGRVPVWVRIRRPLNVALGLRSMRSAPRGGAPAVDAPSAAEVLASAEGRELAAGADRYSTRADLDYLRWRYQPFLADYRAVSEPGGIAIFHLTQRGRLLEGTVCDVLTEQGDRATAAQLLRQVARAAPFDYLTTGAPQPRFVRSPVAGRPLGVTPYRDGVQPDPTDLGSWALTLGDLQRLELC
jgi:GNAT superfamily N-acetyltransferase